LDQLKRKIEQLESRLPKVMIRDRELLGRRLKRLRNRVSGRSAGSGTAAELAAVAKGIEQAADRRSRRTTGLPRMAFPPELPITAKKDEIVAAIGAHPVVIVSGETGSGKTTQIPKFCLAAGRGIDGQIACTQPRRIAATTVARRIAEELGEPLGASVGYKIRFNDRSSPRAYLKIMTDGILLAEAQRDRRLSAYDTVIVDEAHERSLNIDFILGILSTLLRTRDDLKVVITSATIDTEKFSRAFNGAPVIDVSGRMYPVDIRYQPPTAEDDAKNDATYVENAVAAVRHLQQSDPRGDILVFMPTEQDIRETCELLAAELQRPAVVMPLFARLSAAEQQRVFKPAAARKIIVATNVAETSITIPGISYVVDTGLARISRYSPRTRTTALPVTAISRSSADQRAGRCGRVQHGVCIRLYEEEQYLSRPRYTPPEILRANLAEVILRMIDLDLGEVETFPFVDRPDPKSLRDGVNLLFELGAIEEQPEAADGRRAKGASRESRARDGLQLTRTGRLMARLPIDPRLARMLIEADRERCLEEVTVIAAALSVADPRERPAENTAAADRAHALFADPNSDFVTLINIWRRYQALVAAGASNSQRRRFCREHFLSYRRMREWCDIHRQIGEILAEHNMGGGRRPRSAASGNLDLAPEHSRYQAIHRSVLSGFLANIAQRREKMFYQATRGREAMIFPGSGLFGAPPPWLVAAEMVETSRLFARTVARIDSAWLEQVGGGLCRRTCLNPRWDQAGGRVVATEQVSLFGLIIAADRTVSYGPVDPAAATDIFVRSALVQGQIRRPPAFLKHNRRLIEEVKTLEDRLRRRDLLVGENDLAAFYRERLGEVWDLRALAGIIRRRGNDRFLRMSADDVMLYDPAEDELARYPQAIALGGREFDCEYRFEPGHEADGVTLKVPAESAPFLPEEKVDWLVPGLLQEKIATLIRGLPKSLRKRLVPVQDTVALIMQQMPLHEGPLLTALAQFIHDRFGVSVPADAWPREALPEHLKMRIAITAPDGSVLRSGRSGKVLSEPTLAGAAPEGLERYRRRWERSGLTDWDFGDLPEIAGPERQTKAGWIAYPALQKEEGPDGSVAVGLRLFQSRQAALRSHREGVAALSGLVLARDLKFLRRQLALPAELAPALRPFGGLKRFEAMLAEAVIRQLFAADVRSAADFAARIRANSPRLIETARECLAAVIPLLRTLSETRSELSRLAAAAAPAAPVFRAMAGGLDRLVPVNFLELYTPARFGDIERYTRAVGIRAARAQVDFEKDRAKAAAVAPLNDRFQAQLAALSADSSEEKRAALEAFFWMMEEYKVSVFAQELKTAFPVSAKRLAKRLAEIERMV